MPRNLKDAIVLIVSVAVLAGFLFFTDPGSLPLYALLIPFVAVYGICYSIASFLVRKALFRVKPKVQQWLIVTIAALPVLLLILQSSGQINTSDIVLVAVLIAMLMFYFRKTDFLQ